MAREMATSGGIMEKKLSFLREGFKNIKIKKKIKNKRIKNFFKRKRVSALLLFQFFPLYPDFALKIILHFPYPARGGFPYR